MPDTGERYREWDGRQWSSQVGEREVPADSDGRAAAPVPDDRWNKAQWVGEDRDGQRPPAIPPDDMPEGDEGMSGHRHNPGVQNWAPQEPIAAGGTVAAGTDAARTLGHLRTKLIPWDDPDFVREYGNAREAVLQEGLLINGPRAAARVEALMRAAGYPHVSVTVERSAEDALRHAARWTVRRDRAGAAPEK
jgi:hypothetical protein